MSTKIQYKNKQYIFDEIHFPLDTQRKEAVMYLRYPLFEDTGLVNQGFSTKAGGVSEGYFSTMNLGFGRGDSQENVMEELSPIRKSNRCFNRRSGIVTADSYNECQSDYRRRPWKRDDKTTGIS